MLVVTKVLSRKYFCRDKNVFVATKHVFCVYCREKHNFVATKDVFCRDGHVFVATKMILVAAAANDYRFV